MQEAPQGTDILIENVQWQKPKCGARTGERKNEQMQRVTLMQQLEEGSSCGHSLSSIPVLDAASLFCVIRVLVVEEHGMKTWGDVKFQWV
ncbi:hypothetical protein Nepgr_030271 [Nepenthes gracilis]|uniref:Uncharacterized protein n=1 Tax=Nepenthes gracilis TaxID=150966 RepID=A0AAD3TEA5_NEPGR|nr:hypothetical protein Nepgr_030271 [Nepenthes gracilis]